MPGVEGFMWNEEPTALGDFCLDLTEVTAQALGRCVDAGACETAPSTIFWPGIGEGQQRKWSDECNGGRPDRLAHPANCVDWHHAKAFCTAQGGRLPTAMEWDWAARGGDQARVFVWGDQARSTHEVMNACGVECTLWLQTNGRKDPLPQPAGRDAWPTTSPVGSFPAGSGRWGHLDMLGNVTEMTSTFGGAQLGYRNRDIDRKWIGRGGGFRDAGPMLNIAEPGGSGAPSVIRNTYVGFRCAYDPG